LIHYQLLLILMIVTFIGCLEDQSMINCCLFITEKISIILKLIKLGNILRKLRKLIKNNICQMNECYFVKSILKHFRIILMRMVNRF